MVMVKQKIKTFEEKMQFRPFLCEGEDILRRNTIQRNFAVPGSTEYAGVRLKQPAIYSESLFQRNLLN
jgi:hypothetical protein